MGSYDLIILVTDLDTGLKGFTFVCTFRYKLTEQRIFGNNDTIVKTDTVTKYDKTYRGLSLTKIYYQAYSDRGPQKNPM